MSAYPLNQYDLMVPETMKVHCEEGVFPFIYPCQEFMRTAGILRDFQTMITNAGLEHFVEGEPLQYVKLTVDVVQDFRFTWSSSNPMVHYKIYNIAVDLPFADFCAAIRVPQWVSCEKIKEMPKSLMDLYAEICQGFDFSKESGKIRNIQFPAIRYFAYFITKCVLAKKIARKLSSFDLAFIAFALNRNRSYNLGALIAYHLTTNREKVEFVEVSLLLGC